MLDWGYSGRCIGITTLEDCYMYHIKCPTIDHDKKWQYYLSIISQPKGDFLTRYSSEANIQRITIVNCRLDPTKYATNDN